MSEQQVRQGEVTDRNVDLFMGQCGLCGVKGFVTKGNVCLDCVKERMRKEVKKDA